MRYAFFLGAGASKTCNAPLQGEILKDYFLQRRQRLQPYDQEYYQNTDIHTFLYQFFGIDVENDDIASISFPTFEEILGIIDLALAKKDTFPNFENGSANLGAEDRLLACRDRFIGLMAIILKERLSGVDNNHELLIAELKRKNILNSTIFCSTNYDILIDNALLRNRCTIDYGFQFRNSPAQESRQKVSLYKLHGSLNWLYCPTCKKMELTPLEKGAVNYYSPTDFEVVTCRHCESIKRPVIIPPTYFKDFSNYHLNVVWHKAEQALKKVDYIFFCGYSFPDADIQIKYLLKRAEIIRRNKPLRIIVINNFNGKSDDAKSVEESRYKRFFQHGCVTYSESSFSDLIANIDAHLSN